MDLLRLLLTTLSRSGEKEKEPWEKGNSWLIGMSLQPEFIVTKIRELTTLNSENITSAITDVIFNPLTVYYKDMYGDENLSCAITDVNFVVTKV
jgi:hypothetical protein